MKSIANIIHQINFDLIIRNANGDLIYWEDSMGYWAKRKFDLNLNKYYYENGENENNCRNNTY